MGGGSTGDSDAGSGDQSVQQSGLIDLAVQVESQIFVQSELQTDPVYHNLANKVTQALRLADQDKDAAQLVTQLAN